jgi:hypothetical protein
MAAVLWRSLAGKALALAVLTLAACGDDSDPEMFATVPDAPSNMGVSLGEGTVGVNWSVPLNDGGAPIQSYLVTITSLTPGTNYRFTGYTDPSRTSTVVEIALELGVQYSIGVAAQNKIGAGQSASVAVTPGGTLPASYTPLAIQGDTSPSGVQDPSVIRLADGDIWMAYSSVNYHKDADNKLVQDVGIRLARSEDGGTTFKFASIIAVPEPATITDTDPQTRTCGTPTCSGRWVYQGAWLVEDATDPDPARRFKLFAYKYFLLPSKATSTLFDLGAIVMWTAPAPDGNWSAPASILGSSVTPPELAASNLVNAMHGDLATCVSVSQGGANVRGSKLDLVLSCSYTGDDMIIPLPQKIVLLRSTDHGKTFQYVSTLLTQEDAKEIGPVSFTSPSIVSARNSIPVLLATSSAYLGKYVGCVVVPIEDQDAGTVFRKDAMPITLFNVPPMPSHYGGDCAWDAGLGSNGILISDIEPGNSDADTKFRILATGRTL